MINELSKIFSINEDTPLQKISNKLLDETQINLFVKREDLNHPYLSGNKWHKLKYNLAEALKQKQETILTFGGAYSNHIYAVAFAGKVLNLKTIGLIRGEEHLPLNPILNSAEENGMQLYYIDRSTYRHKNESNLISNLTKKFGRFYLIPEGGSNVLAVKGCSEIIKTIKMNYDYLSCSCGTGGTMAGLIAGLKGKSRVLGFSALKGGEFLVKEIICHLENSKIINYTNWEVNYDYHFGGYAKFNHELISFMDNLSNENNLALEPVYTGKMFYGLFDLIRKKKFLEGQTIIVLHTGGLKGTKEFKNIPGFNTSFTEFEANR